MVPGGAIVSSFDSVSVLLSRSCWAWATGAPNVFVKSSGETCT